MKDLSDNALSLEKEPVSFTNSAPPETHLLEDRGQILSKLLKNPDLLNSNPEPVRGSNSNHEPIHGSNSNHEPVRGINSSHEPDETWCSVKELKKINRWAKKLSDRSLQKSLKKGIFPFPFRKSVGIYNTMKYEIQVTDPDEIRALTALRKNSQNMQQDQTTKKGRLTVMLPKKLVSPLKSRKGHVFAEMTLRKFLNTSNIQLDNTENQIVRVSISKDIIEALHVFAKNNKITVSSAFQIALIEFDTIYNNF